MNRNKGFQQEKVFSHLCGHNEDGTDKLWPTEVGWYFEILEAILNGRLTQI